MTPTGPDFPSMPITGSDRPGSGHDIESAARRETLDYIKSMLAELSAIARRERIDMLAYLLEMAYVEASDQIARDAAPASRPRRARAAQSDK